MSTYGICCKCKMELVSRDQHFGPSEFCENCWNSEMADEWEYYVPVINIPELWQSEVEEEAKQS